MPGLVVPRGGAWPSSSPKGGNEIIVAQPCPALEDAHVTGRAAPSPAEQWVALAGALAGRPRVRLSPDGGKNYPARHERDLTGALPAQPAAVLIHSLDGTVATLCLDFDAKPTTGGQAAVAVDVHTAAGLLHASGAAWIEDVSPSGGRHLYVPLAEPLDAPTARELVEAIGVLCPTLDPSPHRSVRSGCIRVPGSRHRTGGHQQLCTPFDHAVAIARHRAGTDAVTRLWEDLADERATLRESRARDAQPAPETDVAAAEGVRRGMSPEMAQIATDGSYDPGRYKSGSEARQAVLVAAAASGMDLTDVQRRIADHTWIGLAQFYARYSPAARQTALGRDWREASRHVRQSGSQTRSTVRRTNTSRPTTHGGPHQQVRTWVNAVAATEANHGSDHGGLTRRLILRALAEAAMKTASLEVSFGVRALAVAVGADAGTVSRHLQALREEDNPLIVRTGVGRGVAADQYRLVVPEHLRVAAEARSWRPGKFHALRPAFRELGVPEAIVFEALEWSGEPLGVRELIADTALSRTAVHDAVATLRAWGLAEPTGAGVILRPGSAQRLERLAEALGCASGVAVQVERYRTERATWHRWLQLRAQLRRETSAGYDSSDHDWELAEPPPPG